MGELTTKEDVDRAIHLMQHALRLREAGARLAANWVAHRAYNMAPTNLAIANDYAAMMTMSHNPFEAKEISERCLNSAPPHLVNPITHNLGLAHLYCGELDKSLQRFTSIAHAWPDAAWDRMHVLFLKGFWEEGFKQAEVRKTRSPEDYPERGMPEWDGSNQPGKTLWVICEQGYGDVFQFARYLPWARSKFSRLIFSTWGGQVPMFYGYPGVDEVRPIGWDMPEPTADYYVYLFSLPGLYGTRVDNIPPDPGHFLKIARNPALNASISTPAERMLKVGLCWAGSPKHKRDYDRTIPTAALAPLIECHRVQFYSFQTGAAARDLDRLGLNGVVVDCEPKIKDSWVATAAGLSCLDLFITIDSAPVHMAGALGIPTWLLLCKMPDWRWMYRGETTPWYPSVELIRQKKLGDWDELIERVATKLKHRQRLFQVVANETRPVQS